MQVTSHSLQSRAADHQGADVPGGALVRSNTAIGAELVLGAMTVAAHVRSIFVKLDLVESPEGSRRVQAVLHWLQSA